MTNGFAGSITFLCTGGGALEIRDEVKYVGDIFLGIAASPIDGKILVAGMPNGAPPTVVASSLGDVEIWGSGLLHIEAGGEDNAQIVTEAGSITVTAERIVIDHAIVGAVAVGVVAGWTRVRLQALSPSQQQELALPLQEIFSYKLGSIQIMILVLKHQEYLRLSRPTTLS